ncbi:hypothetical protein [Streptomyces fradiae]|uniref:hypothetical protein n=1 Tax=Streptomyces fradiae TaxID=1906 RepID=UPI003519603C
MERPDVGRRCPRLTATRSASLKAVVRSCVRRRSSSVSISSSARVSMACSGHQLHDLLAKFEGYVAAPVGWDLESLLDPVELKAERSEELTDGSLHGLVLCERFHGELGLGDEYIAFRPGYRWMPYRGEKPSSLTVD